MMYDQRTTPQEPNHAYLQHWHQVLDAWEQRIGALRESLDETADSAIDELEKLDELRTDVAKAVDKVRDGSEDSLAHLKEGVSQSWSSFQRALRDASQVLEDEIDEERIDMVGQASRDSFPASDPPSFTPTVAPRPDSR